MTHFRHFLFAFLACGGLTSWAADLSGIYQEAVANDPVLGAAKANYKVQKAVLSQARATLLPSLTASGNRSESTQNFTRDTQGLFGAPGDQPGVGAPGTGGVEESMIESDGRTWSAQLSQPLINVAAWHGYGSVSATHKKGQWDLAAAEQNLVIRVVGAYLDVLRQEARYESATKQEQAVQRQLEQIQQRFDVGLVAITDVLESQAAYDNAVVQRIQAEGDHDIFFENLRTITGNAYDSIDRLDENLPIVDPLPGDEETWVREALATNNQIRSAEANHAAAKREARARFAAHLPTISAAASYNYNYTTGLSFFGQENDTTTYSLRFEMPLFQGGLKHARHSEARHRAEQARQVLIEQQLKVARDVRNLFRQVRTDVVRVGARLKAIKSSESALEATETGYEVGTRNIVDVLQAQQRLYSSLFDYADSRYNYVLNLMRLKQAAGSLGPQDIEFLNQHSDAANPVVKLTER